MIVAISSNSNQQIISRASLCFCSSGSFNFIVCISLTPEYESILASISMSNPFPHCTAANFSPEEFLGNISLQSVEKENPFRHLQKQVGKTLSLKEKTLLEADATFHVHSSLMGKACRDYWNQALTNHHYLIQMLQSCWTLTKIGKPFQNSHFSSYYFPFM